MNGNRHSTALITLAGVTLRLRDRHILPGTCWEIRSGQHWAVLGPNGSGKTSLVKALAGEVPVVRGRMIRHQAGCGRDGIGYVSFELHERMIAREEARDDARHFSGDLDGGQTAAELLGPEFPDGEKSPEGERPPGVFDRVVAQMNIGHLLGRGIRRLSTGEMRRVLIARALLKTPWLLILDEPFDGLDPASCRGLHDTVCRLIKGGTQVVLVTHRFEEIFDACTHVICLRDGRVFDQGRRAAVLTPERVDALYTREAAVVRAAPPMGRIPAEDKGNTGGAPVLVEMKNVTVSYGKQVVIEGLDWVMRAGEHWAIQGPNGSGKSTLLRLVTGDHPQAYANDIRLFGRPRGSGETVWEIKQRIGVVSSELHIHYRMRLNVSDVVLSGFFDTVGLYRQADPRQVDTARQWIERLGISHLADRPADQISYGERRMALIARAMVKSPALLVLDEPCQGLDRTHRDVVLDLVNRIGSHTATRLIYVTHHPDETPGCITHVLQLRMPTNIVDH